MVSVACELLDLAVQLCFAVEMSSSTSASVQEKREEKEEMEKQDLCHFKAQYPDQDCPMCPANVEEADEEKNQGVEDDDDEIQILEKGEEGDDKEQEEEKDESKKPGVDMEKVDEGLLLEEKGVKEPGHVASQVQLSRPVFQK